MFILRIKIIIKFVFYHKKSLNYKSSIGYNSKNNKLIKKGVIMVDVKTLELKVRNIRIREKNYCVRIMRRTNSLTEARRLEKFIKQITNCVGIYEDQKAKKFIVQTYKEYNDLADAIRLRDYIELQLKSYK